MVHLPEKFKDTLQLCSKLQIVLSWQATGKKYFAKYCDSTSLGAMHTVSAEILFLLHLSWMVAKKMMAKILLRINLMTRENMTIYSLEIY